MATKEEIIKGVDDFFQGEYDITNGYVIPDVGDIPLGKHGREIEVAILFIDIKESTTIVDSLRRTTAARMYKSFLWGVAQIARANDGELRSFNGDGVLVVFIGDNKRTNAVKAGLQMSWFAKKVLKPKLDAVFQSNKSLQELRIEFDLGIGIDVGKVLVVRGGIRGGNNNDLVWVGNATNYAVRLSELSKDGYMIYISEDVYKNMDKSSKFSGNPEKDMWESRVWNDMGGIKIYRSNWTWTC
ncbi:MAG: adenylate/guanylate cyclase domain-containing protein [Ignavibacteriaceae bacterium]